ncbi:endonuclease/exonuclease/phosphatase family protein [Flavobacterium mesophilum]|uniref:endonuclease/exonuclease/phosphatase family protein n=1 Tax=Flavobacterium mesophilum TaxID=3143495 RepID=UPI0031DCBFF8
MKLKLSFFLFLLFAMNVSFAQIDSKKSRTIRVLTFNIYHGETMKGDFNLDVIAKVINDANPDFVALQEVDFKTNRAKKYDLVTELGIRTKLCPLFAKAMNFDGGEYGEGILSRYSIISSRNVNLPYTKGNEPKNAVEIVSVLPSGDTIAFVGTHLDYKEIETDRINQVKKINSVFLKNKYPTILAGDLNSLPDSTPMKILEEKWGTSYDKNNPQFTFPSSKPEKTIDYIMFAPKKRWKVLSREVIQDSVASDHCAYLVTLELFD